MRYGQIPGVGKPVSRLAQGVVPLNTQDEGAAFALLDGVFSEGCSAFDTAHVYGADRERLFGRWVAERGIRDQVVIISKGCHHNADRARVTPFDLAADLRDSMDRMGVDYVDIYLLHRDDPNVPVGPIVEALNEHVAAGRIRAFGGSNWTHDRIAEANLYAQERGLIPFACSSPNYSLAVQRQEPWPGCVSISGPRGAAAREWYQSQQMPLLCWSSLGGGIFSGRFRPDNLDSFTDYLDRICAGSYGTPENFARVERCRAAGESIGLSAAQMALAWLFHQPLDIYALTGCQTPAEFAANAAALNVSLSSEDELAILGDSDGG